MPTFIYAPGVKVYISTAKNGLVDVSEDLTEGTMVRRSDGVSTFNFAMNNPRRKYDSVFAPNDRIIVMMKRLAWVRTFTGLLNSVPLLTAWPRVVPLAASCSLKRLQYWYWDSYTAASQQMIQQALSASRLDRRATDGGVTNVALTILKNVVGWPESKVHIARIPDDWFKIAHKVAEQIDERAEEADALAQEFYATLNGGGMIGGVGATTGGAVNGVLQAGKYAGVDLKGDQLRHAEVIYSVCKGMGGSDRDAILGLACAMQESTLNNLSGGDRDSVGLFQQRPSMGWGTVAQCTTPSYAAGEFYKRLLKMKSRDSMRETDAIQAVQRSGFPDAYQKWVPMAQAIVRMLSGGSGIAGDARYQNERNAGNLTTRSGGTIGTSTGQAYVNVAVKCVQDNPNIPYRQANGPGNAPTNPNPTFFDCSSFARWAYTQTLGSLYDMPRTAHEQALWCQRNGMRRLTAEEGLKTPGALMFAGSLSSKVYHVEISLGTGNQTVGSHSASSRPNTGVDTYGSVASAAANYDFAYLLPRISYDGIGVGGGIAPSDLPDVAGVQGTSADPTTGSSVPGYNPDDPFDKLFGDNPWYPLALQDNPQMQLAEGLVGIRALLNDQPLLPYIKNLMNSTMRSFCSAPNGDLIGWFPDYYGLWGTAAKMVIEPIEVQDFTVEWSDDFFVTHQFTLAGQPGTNLLNEGDGSVSTDFATGTGADIKTTTLGIANIDVPAIMYALFGIDATQQEAKNFARYIYKRFGARPDFQEMEGLVGPKAEFFSALFLFMRQWAYQYNADIPLTFMPELWPGMLIQIPKFDFQAYVTTVTHTFRFGEGGGFGTTVNIAAPARMPKKKGDRDNVLIGLPLAGEYKPGRGVGNTDPSASEGLAAQQTVRLPSGKEVPI